jgi:hypothetical protein
MPPKLQAQIPLAGNRSLIRDLISAILVVESADQVAKATTASEPDPSKWAFRVFTQRSNPWDEFNGADKSPIVNVRYDSHRADRSKSAGISHTHGRAVYHIDCYGYGVSESDGGTGHVPGDLKAADESQRAGWMVESILMSGYYMFLGDTRGSSQFILGRWIDSVEEFQPQIDDQPVENVIANRVTLGVEFNEFTQEYQGVPLSLVSFEVQQASNGQVLLNADYPIT